jgi:hypothetical protein
MTALPLALALAVAGTVPPEGPWRLESQSQKTRVLSWGLFCGKEPAKTSRGIPGANYALQNQGEDFTLSGAGKVLSTKGCSLDPAAFRLRQRDRAGDTIKVECEAPAVAGQPVVTQHTWSVVSPKEIKYITVGDKRKTEGMDACRYAYELEMVFVAATEAGPCAEPGPAAKVLLDPATKDAQPGERVCFKAQAVDAKGCAVPGSPTQFKVEGGDATVDPQGCLWTPRKPEATVVLGVTATQGSVSGSAMVRVLVAGQPPPKETLAETVQKSGSQRMRSMVSEVMAGDFVLKTPHEEDEDEGAVSAPAAPPRGGGFPLWVLVLAGGVLVVLGGVVSLRGRGRRPASAPASVPRPVAAPVVPEVAVPAAGQGYICPVCNFQYDTPGTCTHDGTTLVLNDQKTRQTMFIPSVGGMICLTCGQRYPRRAKFCGNDRTPLVPDLPGVMGGDGNKPK